MPVCNCFVLEVIFFHCIMGKVQFPRELDLFIVWFAEREKWSFEKLHELRPPRASRRSPTIQATDKRPCATISQCRTASIPKHRTSRPTQTSWGGGGNPQRSEHSSPSSPRRDCTECQHQLSVALTLPPSSHIPAYLLLLRLLLQRCSRCARRRKAKQTGALCRLPLSPPQKTTVGRREGLEARVDIFRSQKREKKFFSCHSIHTSYNTCLIVSCDT